jgi:hypothetical protein
VLLVPKSTPTETGRMARMPGFERAAQGNGVACNGQIALDA